MIAESRGGSTARFSSMPYFTEQVGIGSLNAAAHLSSLAIASFNSVDVVAGGSGIQSLPNVAAAGLSPISGIVGIAQGAIPIIIPEQAGTGSLNVAAHLSSLAAASFNSVDVVANGSSVQSLPNVAAAEPVLATQQPGIGSLNLSAAANLSSLAAAYIGSDTIGIVAPERIDDRDRVENCVFWHRENFKMYSLGRDFSAYPITVNEEKDIRLLCEKGVDGPYYDRTSVQMGSVDSAIAPGIASIASISSISQNLGIALPSSGIQGPAINLSSDQFVLGLGDPGRFSASVSAAPCPCRSSSAISIG
jgi:hypothetical protein